MPTSGKLLGGNQRRKPAEVRRVGAGEPVDRLVGIADHAQVAAVAEPGPQQAELRGAGVLELVDEEVAEAPPLRGGELGVALEHVGAAGDEVVEVDEPALALLALVAAEDRRRPRPAGAGWCGRRRRPPARSRRASPAGPWPTRSRRRARRRASAPSRPRRREQRQEDPDLAFEQRGHGAALFVGPAAELRQRDGVERAGGDRLAHAEAGRGAARSSPAALRVKVTARTWAGSMSRSLRLPRDAPGEHARLARPRAGEDRQRRGAAGDRVALRRVETVEERVHLRHGTARVRRSCRRCRRVPDAARNSRRPRVVSAASQLGSPRGRSCRPRPTPRPRVAPGARPRLSVSGFPHLPGVVPFGSVTAPDPSGPSSGCSRPFRSLPTDLTPTDRAARTVRAFRHRTGVHRPSHRKDARTRLQGEISRRSRYRPAGGRRSRSERSNRWSPTRSTSIPPTLGARDGERRGGRRGLAERGAAGAASAPGGTLLGLYEGVPITRRGPLSYSGVAPDRITIFRGPLSRCASDVDDLAARVRVTVLHEVGHYFGMSDERLHELAGRSLLAPWRTPTT